VHKTQTDHVSVTDVSFCLVRLVATGIIEKVNIAGIVMYSYISLNIHDDDTAMKFEYYVEEDVEDEVEDEMGRRDEDNYDEEGKSTDIFDSVDPGAGLLRKARIGNLQLLHILNQYISTYNHHASASASASASLPTPSSVVSMSLEKPYSKVVDIADKYYHEIADGQDTLNEEKLVENIALCIFRDQQVEIRQQKNHKKINIATERKDFNSEHIWMELNSAVPFHSKFPSSLFRKSTSAGFLLPYPLSFPTPPFLKLSPLFFSSMETGFDSKCILEWAHKIFPSIPKSLLTALLSLHNWDAHVVVDMLFDRAHYITKVTQNILARILTIKEDEDSDDEGEDENFVNDSYDVGSLVFLHYPNSQTLPSHKSLSFLLPPLFNPFIRSHLYNSALAGSRGLHLQQWPVGCEAFEEWVRGRDGGIEDGDTGREQMNAAELLTVLASYPTYTSLSSFFSSASSSVSLSPVSSSFTSSSFSKHLHDLRYTYESYSALSRLVESKANDCHIQISTFSSSSTFTSSFSSQTHVQTLQALAHCWQTLASGLAVIANMQIALSYYFTHPLTCSFTYSPIRDFVTGYPPEILQILPSLITSMSSLTNIAFSLERGLTTRDEIGEKKEGGRDACIKEAIAVLKLRLYRLIDFIHMILPSRIVSSLEHNAAVTKTDIHI